jgi:hypothetical protein
MDAPDRKLRPVVRARPHMVPGPYSPAPVWDRVKVFFISAPAWNWVKKANVTAAGKRVKITEGHLIMPPKVREIGLKVMKGGYNSCPA